MGKIVAKSMGQQQMDGLATGTSGAASAADVADAGNVRDIATAKKHGAGEKRRAGGRPSGLGYDPATGEEVVSSTYKAHATRESSAEYDVFTLVDERGYRADRFYTRSLNADGHGERLNVRLPQGIDSQIHAAVSEVPQYRNIHDFARDAFVHRLEWLQKQYELGDNARRVLELERITADGERRVQETEVMQDAVDKLTARLQMLSDRQDWGLMREELEKGGELTDWLRDPYRKAAREVLGVWKARTKADIAKMLESMEKE